MDPIDKLSKEQIVAALSRLNELLHEKGVMGEICIFGGAAMVLAFDARESTRAVDGISVPKTEVIESARQVAPNLRAILLQESPAAFRVRNRFVSANALSRA